MHLQTGRLTSTNYPAELAARGSTLYFAFARFINFDETIYSTLHLETGIGRASSRHSGALVTLPRPPARHLLPSSLWRS